jgi:O-antigen/teichoic acid export membrane protein
MTVSVRRDLTGLIDQGVVSASSLLTTMIFIRGAGMEEFGVLSLVWLVLLFAISAQHALVIAPAHTMLPKLSVEDSRAFRGWLVLVQAAFLCLLVGLLVASWFAPWFSLLPAAGGLLPALAFLCARQLCSFFRLLLFAREDGAKRALLVDSVHATLSFSSLAYLAATEQLQARSGLWALAGSALLAALIAGPFYFRQGFRIGHPGADLAARHLQLSKWLIGKAVAQWFSANSFLTALGTIQGAAALGGVRAAQTLIGTCGIVLQSVGNLLPARASRVLEKSGRRELSRFLSRSVVRWYGFLLLGLIPILVFPFFFLQLLTGERQPDLLEPLYFFALGSILSMATLHLQIFLRAVEQVRAIFLAQVFPGVIGLLFAVPVTSAYGIRGCMIGLLVQQVVVLCILLVPVRRKLAR